MKEKKLFEKIFITIICSAMLCLFAYGFIKFIIAKNQWDDDGMFFWGLCISVTAGMIFILFLVTSIISSTWQKDDKFITIYKAVLDDLLNSRGELFKQIEEQKKEIAKLKKAKEIKNEKRKS